MHYFIIIYTFMFMSKYLSNMYHMHLYSLHTHTYTHKLVHFNIVYIFFICHQNKISFQTVSRTYLALNVLLFCYFYGMRKYFLYCTIVQCSFLPPPKKKRKAPWYSLNKTSKNLDFYCYTQWLSFLFWRFDAAINFTVKHFFSY